MTIILGLLVYLPNNTSPTPIPLILYIQLVAKDKTFSFVCLGAIRGTQESLLAVLRDHIRFGGWNLGQSSARQVPYLLYHLSGPKILSFFQLSSNPLCICTLGFLITHLLMGCFQVWTEL